MMNPISLARRFAEITLVFLLLLLVSCTTAPSSDPAVQEDAAARAMEQPEMLLLGMDPWTLLLAFSVAVAAALVLLVLLPLDGRCRC